MRSVSRLAVIGAFAMFGVGQAVADPLGVDFVSTPSSSPLCGPPLLCSYPDVFGYSFTVGNAPVTLEGLAVFAGQEDPNTFVTQYNLGAVTGGSGGTAAMVQLWDGSGNALTPVVTINASAQQNGLWAVESLATPITLAANTTYVVGAIGPNGVWNFFGGEVPINVDPDITYVQDQYFDSSSLQFPSDSAGVLVPGCTTETECAGWFGANIELASAGGGDDPVPEPMSLSLFGVGLAGLGFLRRRKRA